MSGTIGARAQRRIECTLSFHGFHGDVRSRVRAYQEWTGLPSSGRLTRRTVATLAQRTCSHPLLSIQPGDHEKQFAQRKFRAAELLDESDAEPEVYVDTSIPMPARRFELVPCRWNRRRLSFSLVGAFPKSLAESARAAVRSAFATWSKTDVVTITERRESSEAEIRVLWTPGPKEDPSSTDPFYGPGGTVAISYYPYRHLGVLAGDLHLDSNENWSVTGAMESVDIETIALHEIGHCLGLGHCRDQYAVMWPYYKKQQRDLTQDDIDELRRHYAGVSE